ncbi:MAG: ester cyclase [Mycobacterium gordonae]|nr:ester cyclase [Mycobacterium gordonae]
MIAHSSDDQASTLVCDLVTRFYRRLWNEWDDAAVGDTLAPGITFRGSLGQTTVGLDAWRSYRDQIHRAAPDFHNELLDLITTHNRAAARLRYTGTHRATLLDIPATGRVFSYTGAAFFTVANGLITDIWVLGDLDGLRQQLA